MRSFGPSLTYESKDFVHRKPANGPGAVDAHLDLAIGVDDELRRMNGRPRCVVVRANEIGVLRESDIVDHLVLNPETLDEGVRLVLGINRKCHNLHRKSLERIDLKLILGQLPPAVALPMAPVEKKHRSGHPQVVWNCYLAAPGKPDGQGRELVAGN